jgi:cystathionine gamma-synthase
MAADGEDARRVRPQTLAAQALGWIAEPHKEVVPPVHVSTTYLREPDNSYPTGRVYSRDHNPTYEQAEALLAELEGGQACKLFASGLAAATSVFLALKPGDHVVVPEIMYWALRGWLVDYAMPRGLAVDFVANGDLAAIEKAIRPGTTKLVWLETPANPTWACTDIAGAAQLAHDAGAALAVDSTCATPVLTRPIGLGADIVMHSATKFLNGHSDVIAGALVTADADSALWAEIARVRNQGGAVLGPFEAWLLLRGMRTLYVRVDAICRTAQKVAAHFESHPAVRAVLYPGLASHPTHDIAQRQMSEGYGGMMAIRMAAGAAKAVSVAAHTRLFKRATSLGSVESLIEHRASIEGPDTPVPADLLRISIGLEHADDLIADLERAMAAND